jgi:hypothetical protein
MTASETARPDEGMPPEGDGDGTPVCYLIVDEYTRPGKPAGVLRRVIAPDGEITDERVFRRNLAWHDVTGRYPVPGTDRDLFEIPHGEAVRVIAAMHLSAARADDPEEEPGITATSKPTMNDLGIAPGTVTWDRSGDGPGSVEIAFPDPPAGREGEWERGDWVLMRVSGPDGGGLVLVFDRNEWACFLDGVRNGEFDPASPE